jgi:hypothetical protein
VSVPTYDVMATKDVMVPMRDGVRLATDVYLPCGRDGRQLAGRLPVLLCRTPYDKAGSRPDPEVLLENPPAPPSPEVVARRFAARGYAVVIQDTRGRFASEGAWRMMTDDGPDGYDTCAWICQQPWSNGRIGMYGVSYVGGTQHAAAMAGAPGLATVTPTDAMSNMGYQSLRNAGAFELRFWNWLFVEAGHGSRQAQDPATKAMLAEMARNRRYYLQQLPTLRGTTPLKHAPEYEDYLVEAMQHGCNDEFWAQNNIIDHGHLYKDIPVYLQGGWYDSWGGNTTANYRVLSQQLKSPVYLIMGPWTHGQQATSAHGQVSFGADAAISDVVAWRAEWFDRWLKDEQNSVGRAAPFATPVRIFVMGTGDGSRTPARQLNHGGYWRDEHEWPLARTRYTPYYAHEGGLLSPRLSTDEDSSTSYDFDPRDPVPTIGGNLSSTWGIALPGGWDQRGGDHIWNWPKPIPLSARRDVLVFQTEPLEADLEVTGELEVKLWASSSALDTDFTAKLIDVYPPSPDFPGGFDLNLEDGIIRARFRESLAEETLMTPGEVYEFTIKLYPTSNVFKKGHRVRLDISSSNFPRFDVNPNTGEPLALGRRMAVATNTVFHDRRRPSHIILPVIPG